MSDANSYASYSIMRYCVPDYDTLDSSIQSEWENMKYQFKESTAGGFMVDLYDAKWIFLMSLAIAVVLTLIYVKFLDWFAFWLAWISVAVI